VDFGYVGVVAAVCKDVLNKGPIINKNLSKLRGGKPLGGKETIRIIGQRAEEIPAANL